MTRDGFRKLALGFPEAEERSHQGSPDFRVRGKIFATLGPRDPKLVVVKLPREEQEMRVATEPTVFAPIAGAWGRQGWTTIDLTAADKVTVQSALATAWRSVAPKRLAATLKP